MSTIKNCIKCGRLYTGSEMQHCISCAMTGALTKHSAQKPAATNRAARRAAASKNTKHTNAKSAPSTQNPQTSAKPTHQKTRTPNTSQRYYTIDSNQATPHPGVICILCGIRVRSGDMLTHKEKTHGEKRIVPSPELPHQKGRWVSICSGGLPSLGKRSK